MLQFTIKTISTLSYIRITITRARLSHMAKMASILHFLAIYLSCSLLFFLSQSQTDQSLSHSGNYGGRSHDSGGHQSSHGSGSKGSGSSGPGSRGSGSRGSGSYGSGSSGSYNKPNLLVLPVKHDSTTGLPWAYVHKRTPLLQVPVLLDLNVKHMWINCEQHYQSSTYQAPFCHSTQCTRANINTCHSCVSSSRPGCHNNTCGLMSVNPITDQTAMGELAEDVFAIQTISGSKLGPLVTVPQFLFSCAPSMLVQKGLPKGVQGVAGLGHGPISLPNQLASHFGFQHQFTICLSSNPSSTGAIIFGDAQNNLHYNNNDNNRNNNNDNNRNNNNNNNRNNNNNNNRNNKVDIFRDLQYTPLVISPQGEYFIVLSAIRVNQRSVYPITPSSTSTGSSSYSLGGVGDTLISTSSPYMVLHHSIFETLKQAFASQMPRQAQVNPVGPFGLCFDSKKLGSYSGTPSVELVMEQNPEVVWKISGNNLLVQANPGVSCLGIVDGGLRPRAAITIGAHQLEENVVVFDLARSRFGFSTSSLQSRGTKCGDLFDFSYGNQHP